MIHKIDKKDIQATGKDHVILDPASKVKVVAGDIVEIPGGGYHLVRTVRLNYWHHANQNYQQTTYLYTRNVKRIKSASMIKNKDKTKVVLEISKGNSYVVDDLVYSFGKVWEVKKVTDSLNLHDQQLHVKEFD